LGDQFSEIEGVDQVEHMDREIFRITAPELEYKRFKKLIWDKFLEVAEEAFQDRDED
jgi:hypothetical protein